MLNEPQEILPPLDPQCIEHARQIHKYITQLTQLWNIGHRHVKQNVMLLQRFEGNVPLVTANLNS